MQTLVLILVLLIALEHLGFLILEMFLWTKVLGRKMFSRTKDEAQKTKVLAANLGLYNGFLAAGLVWGMFHTNIEFSKEIIIAFLIMISIAGIYGGLSAKKSIFFIQGLPALITLGLIMLMQYHH